MAIEIVDLAIKNGGSFHGKMLVYQRVVHLIFPMKKLPSEVPVKLPEAFVLTLSRPWGGVPAAHCNDVTTKSPRGH